MTAYVVIYSNTHGDLTLGVRTTEVAAHRLADLYGLETGDWSAWEERPAGMNEAEHTWARTAPDGAESQRIETYRTGPQT